MSNPFDEIRSRIQAALAERENQRAMSEYRSQHPHARGVHLEPQVERGKKQKYRVIVGMARLREPGEEWPR